MPYGVIPRSAFKRGHIPWHFGIKFPMGKKTHCSRGHEYNDQDLHMGWRFCRKCQNESRKKRRHDIGINQKYNKPYSSYGKARGLKKYYNQRISALNRMPGELPIERIQLVYEDNIKQYGTLTCYLCGQVIQFGKDTLEHKIPLSRGGNHEYKNLAIACHKCNSSKKSMTEEEYRKKKV